MLQTLHTDALAHLNYLHGLLVTSIELGDYDVSHEVVHDFLEIIDFMHQAFLSLEKMAAVEKISQN